jgi:hypothetical protein
MERTDIQLEKEKEKFTEKSRKSKLTEKIEEYSLSRIDELSVDNSYQVRVINKVNSTSTNIRRTGKDRWREVTEGIRNNESNIQK